MVNRGIRPGGFPGGSSEKFWATVMKDCGPRLKVTFPAQDLGNRKVGIRKLCLYQVKGGYVGIPMSSDGQTCRFKLLLRDSSTGNWDRDVIDLASSLAFLCADGWEADPSKRVPVSGQDKGKMLETIRSVLMAFAMGCDLDGGIEVKEMKELGLEPSGEDWFSYLENGEPQRWTYQSAFANDAFRDHLLIAALVNMPDVLVEHMLWMGMTPIVDVDLFARSISWFQRMRLSPVICDDATVETGDEQELISGMPVFFRALLTMAGMTVRREYNKSSRKTGMAKVAEAPRQADKAVPKKATAPKVEVAPEAKKTSKKIAEKKAEVVAEAKAVAKKTKEKIVAKKKAPAKSRAKKVAASS